MRFEPGRHRTAENLLRAKHVVAAGLFVRDAGSTPAASTILNFVQLRSGALCRDGGLGNEFRPFLNETVSAYERIWRFTGFLIPACGAIGEVDKTSSAFLAPFFVAQPSTKIESQRYLFRTDPPYP